MYEVWTRLEWLEGASYLATIITIPTAIASILYLFRERQKQLHEDREARRIEREENYSDLQSEFRKAQYLLIEHPELDQHETPLTDPALLKQQKIYYSNLVSLFEQSFILFHKPEDPEYERMWNSWSDYIGEWLVKPNFRSALPELMVGEDPDFMKYIQSKVGEKYDRAPLPAGTEAVILAQ
jgi:hypothetical protein